MLPLHYTPMRRAENTIPIPFRTYHLAGVGVTFTLYSPLSEHKDSNLSAKASDLQSDPIHHLGSAPFAESWDVDSPSVTSHPGFQDQLTGRCRTLHCTEGGIRIRRFHFLRVTHVPILLPRHSCSESDSNRHYTGLKPVDILPIGLPEHKTKNPALSEVCIIPWWDIIHLPRLLSKSNDEL